MKLSICSIDYSENAEEEIPTINLICRDENYNRQIVKVTDFKPYFYLKKSDFELIKKQYREGYKRIENLIEKTDDFYEEPVTYSKIYTKLPRHVKNIREELKSKEAIRALVNPIRTFEADVLFPLRFMIDNKIFNGIDYNPITQEITPVELPSWYRYFSIDIEVLLSEVKDISKAEGEVIVVGIYDSLTDSYYIFTTKDYPELSKLDSYLLEKKKLVVKLCRNEKHLYFEILKFFEDNNPDIILSFSQFDMAYLIYRSRALKISMKSLSPIGISRIFTDEKVKISGVQVMDINEMYRKTLRTAKWETLDEICTRELSKGRVFHDSDVYTTWLDKDNYWKVIARNLRDVELVKLLNTELELLEQFDTLRRTVGVNFRDTFLASRLADVMFLRETNGKMVLPTRRIQWTKYPYTGAVVFKNEKGKHKNLVVFDFKEMYPSFIYLFNISWDTYFEYPVENSIMLYEKHYFYFGKKGMTLNILDKVRPLREIVRTEMKQFSPLDKRYKILKARSDAYKSIINAVYGYYGFGGDWEKHMPSARLYAPWIAEAITYPGREILMQCVIPTLQILNYDMKYGDTDSIFIQLKTDDLEQESLELQKQLSASIKDYIKNKWGIDSNLFLELDKIVTSAIMFTKKRYILKTNKGEIITKGLETVRRESALVTKEIQDNVLNMMIEDKTQEEITDYLVDFIKKFKERNLRDIAFSPKLTQNPSDYGSPAIQLQAYEYSKKYLGVDLKPGERFYMIYIKSIPTSYPDLIIITINKKDKKTGLKYKKTDAYKIKVLAFKDSSQIPKGTIVDYDTMIDKTIHKKIDDMLEILGINWNTIYSKTIPQKSLSSFF